MTCHPHGVKCAQVAVVKLGRVHVKVNGIGPWAGDDSGGASGKLLALPGRNHSRVIRLRDR